MWAVEAIAPWLTERLEEANSGITTEEQQQFETYGVWKVFLVLKLDLILTESWQLDS